MEIFPAIFPARFLQLFFGFTDRGDFRLGVDDSGNGIVIHMTVPGDDAFDTGDGFFFGLVSQHRTTDHITDRVNALRGGSKAIVDGMQPLSSS